MPTGPPNAAGSASDLRLVVAFTRLGLFALVVAVLWVAQDIIIPAAIAVVLAFVLMPVVTRLERVGAPRWVAVPLTVVATSGVVLLIGWIVAVQSLRFTEDLPAYRTKVREKVAALADRTNGLFARAQRGMREVERQVNDAATALTDQNAPPERSADDAPGAERPVPPAAGDPSRVASPIDSLHAVGTVAGLAIAPLVQVAIVLFMASVILLRREELRDRIIALAGHEQLHRTTGMMDEAARQLGRLLLTQLLIAVAFAVLFTLVLLAAGVPNAILFGALVVPMRFVPVIGTWISLALPMLLAGAVLDGWTPMLATAGGFLVLETTASYVIEPWALGKRTGMSLTAVLLALIFWTWLWGAAGLVLAMPITTSLAVLGRRVRGLGWIATLLNEESGLTPSARMYQRLLAIDLDQALAIARAERERTGLDLVYATVMLPALAALERDRQSGELDPVRAAFAIDGLAEIADSLALDHGAANEVERRVTPRRVVVVPAHGAADAVTARMLMHAAIARGQEASALPVGDLVSERAAVAANLNADVVCVCAMPPLAESHVRLLLERLRVAVPADHITVALWQDEVDAFARERLAEGGAKTIVTTFDEALRALVG